ncbi:MAG: hypothetical protein ACYTXC_10790, partial [Nostoc sp.]
IVTLTYNFLANHLDKCCLKWNETALLKKGGTGIKVPLFKGDLGRSPRVKRIQKNFSNNLLDVDVGWVERSATQLIIRMLALAKPPTPIATTRETRRQSLMGETPKTALAPQRSGSPTKQFFCYLGLPRQ